MNTHNAAFQNSLRCLQHPSSLICIAILLLNDHVFKLTSPSWVTGKLSDFAGLFFFPFLVAVILSALLSRFRIRPEPLGQIIFSFVAIWFSLIKTFPPINAVTSSLASFFIQGTAQIALDPTDLMALIILLPAWKLWQQSQQAKTSNRLAYAAFVMGSVATLATSPQEWAVSSVTDLAISDDGVIYAADRENFGQETYPIAKSLDGGLTWERDFEKDSLPNLHEKRYPIQACNSRSETLNHNCYRVTSNHQLEQYGNKSWVRVFPSDLSVRAYDIIIFTRENNNYMLVAIGEAGVLRRDLPQGNWEIIPVINAGSR